jgi:hypothetical protein
VIFCNAKSLTSVRLLLLLPERHITKISSVLRKSGGNELIKKYLNELKKCIETYLFYQV